MGNCYGCEKFKENMPCYDDYRFCEKSLEEHDAKVREDAIDECIEWAKAFREAHYYNMPYKNLMEYSKGFKRCIESVIENLEELKEKENE